MTLSPWQKQMNSHMDSQLKIMWQPQGTRARFNHSTIERIHKKFLISLIKNIF